MKPGQWFYTDTEYLYRNGIMTGVTEDEFKPTAVMSRAEFVTVLHRIAGEPKAIVKAEFADVESNAWYYEHLSWACETGLINGYPDGTFRPTGEMKRYECGSILHKLDMLVWDKGLSLCRKNKRQNKLIFN